MVPQWAKRDQQASINLPLKSHAILFRSGRQIGSNKTRLHKAQQLLHAMMQNCKSSFSDDKLTGTFAKTRFAWLIDVKKGFYLTMLPAGGSGFTKLHLNSLD